MIDFVYQNRNMDRSLADGSKGYYAMGTSQVQRVKKAKTPRRDRQKHGLDLMWKIALERIPDERGKETRRVSRVFRKMFEQAETGDVPSATFIFDRLLGKPTQHQVVDASMTHQHSHEIVHILQAIETASDEGRVLEHDPATMIEHEAEPLAAATKPTVEE